MNSSEKYKLELNSYFSLKGKEECDLCAGHFYGKFLNYIEDNDYVGASLAKRFLMRGDWRCSQNGYEGNRFNSFYKNAHENKKFKRLKIDFFYDDSVERREREMEAAVS